MDRPKLKTTMYGIWENWGPLSLWGNGEIPKEHILDQFGTWPAGYRRVLTADVCRSNSIKAVLDPYGPSWVIYEGYSPTLEPLDQNTIDWTVYLNALSGHLTRLADIGYNHISEYSPSHPLLDAKFTLTDRIRQVPPNIMASVVLAYPEQVRMGLLKRLADDNGFLSTMDMLEQTAIDSVSPAICASCNYITEMEPDAEYSTCPECNQPAVSSALVLAGVI